ncbi:MAG: hypothetical protein H6543_04485 [Prevotellaceae bacterium]|nr:hypothetical protein [Prevotellaceae bacterium]
MTYQDKNKVVTICLVLFTIRYQNVAFADDASGESNDGKFHQKTAPFTELVVNALLRHQTVIEADTYATENE